ncbi:MAG TPA: hypothetical protein VKK81_27680 [Candidatus Binatia bacterium]|nr:hypothetical protein [Candidatus Binatia bacterium]
MLTFLRAKCWKVLLVGVVLSALLMPTCVLSAKQEETVLFVSVEDLDQMLAHPSLPSLISLLSLSQPSFSMAWWETSETVEQDSSLERNADYGNRLWVDGYRLPGPHPLWGY